MWRPLPAARWIMNRPSPRKRRNSSSGWISFICASNSVADENCLALFLERAGSFPEILALHHERLDIGFEVERLFVGLRRRCIELPLGHRERQSGGGRERLGEFARLASYFLGGRCVEREAEVAGFGAAHETTRIHDLLGA